MSRLITATIKTATPIPPSQATINLVDLLVPTQSPAAINSAYAQLVAKGWCLVRLDEEFVSDVSKCIEPFNQFFAKDKSYKERYFMPPIWGYTSVKHKEGFRLLTGNRLIHPASGQSPTGCGPPFIHLASKLDVMMTAMIDAVGPTFFNNKTTAELGHEFDLPLLKADGRTQAFGMIDVVRYFNKAPLPISVRSNSNKKEKKEKKEKRKEEKRSNKKRRNRKNDKNSNKNSNSNALIDLSDFDNDNDNDNDNDDSNAILNGDDDDPYTSTSDASGPPLNCAAHYDPGLLSLSFLSTYPGLELQDPATKQWYAPPSLAETEEAKYIAVLWTGDAAVRACGGKMPAAVHRVVFPPTLGDNTPTPPRMAIWYEICTSSQEPKQTPAALQLNPSGLSLDFGNRNNDISISNRNSNSNSNRNRNSARPLENLVDIATPVPLSNESPLEYSLRVERKLGLPASKSRARVSVKPVRSVLGPKAPKPGPNENKEDYQFRIEEMLGVPMSKSGD